jgi:hypothetical protein
MDLHEGEEEILAIADYYHDGSHGRIDRVDTGFSRSAFYLHLVLI